MEFVGIGNALMDVIAFVDEDFAPSLGFHNNTVVHMDRTRLGEILELLPSPFVSAGGGAANTMRTAALLGMKATYVGRVGEDELGLTYRQAMAASGVEALISGSDAPTGVFCALIRPDRGRTLLVAPGAALDLDLDPPPDAMFRSGALLYIEGFLLRDRAFLMDCVRRAGEAGMEVALDIGSQSLARAERDFLLEFLPEYCDLVFANEDEFSALSDLPLREGLDFFSDCDMAIVVKRAERGAVWFRDGVVIDSPVRHFSPVDETGAGDSFAAGFLAGRARGLAPERCLRLGNRVAEEVLMVPGLMIDPVRLRKAVEEVAF